MWIDANFKEVELTYLETGQAVSVTVDAYPDHAWKGVVQSVSPATGAEFSVLPAQNATGNWVKVVQRISVRIKLEMTDGHPTLRAGMSTVVQVDTHHKRELPAFAQTALSWVGINQAEAQTTHTGRSTDARNNVQ
jgi:membrane fusion protein (multidrug efflux system)